MRSTDRQKGPSDVLVVLRPRRREPARGNQFIEIKDPGWEGCYVQLLPADQKWFENGKTLYEGWVTTWCVRGYFTSYLWSIRIIARKTD
ncbi:hypothetical protein ACIRL2_40190 [Embleya sp. NPDC127516]|uniref:hypothetical protein n=1 Tax=Embleya sp. NPDC127516 TaxID=3363990 RepID=UPI0038189E9B